MEGSLEVVISMLGILKAGGVYMPLDPAYPSARLASMAHDGDVRVILTQPHLRARENLAGDDHDGREDHRGPKHADPIARDAQDHSRDEQC